MTLLEIEAFLAIVKYGNITAASENLYISQPTLTRRIQQMEHELGYPVLERQKGHRSIRLTEQGKEFYRIAWKWQQLLEETSSISQIQQQEILSIASVYSVNQYLLKYIFPEYIEQNFRLQLYNTFSEDVYKHMADGLFDLAFVELQDFLDKIPNDVHTKPAFSESFVLASYKELPSINGFIDLKQLNRKKEIFIPWNKEYKLWHSEHLIEQFSPLVFLEDVSMLNCFLINDNWAIVPYSAGENFKLKGIHVYSLENTPPNRIIYYVTRNHKTHAIREFLLLLHALLQAMPRNAVQSYLG